MTPDTSCPTWCTPVWTAANWWISWSGFTASTSSGRKHCLQILQHLGRLPCDAAGDNLLRRRVERNLPSRKNEIPRTHGLRIRPDSRRRSVGCDNRFIHAVNCNGTSERACLRFQSRSSGTPGRPLRELQDRSAIALSQFCGVDKWRFLTPAMQADHVTQLRKTPFDYADPGSKQLRGAL